MNLLICVIFTGKKGNKMLNGYEGMDTGGVL